jgi:hypothetical protein
VDSLLPPINFKASFGMRGAHASAAALPDTGSSALDAQAERVDIGCTSLAATTASPENMKAQPLNDPIASPQSMDEARETSMNALDCALPALSPAVAAALTPEKPDPSFSKMVREANDFRLYSQAGLCYSDPEGDAHLIRHIDAIPAALAKGLYSALKGKSEPGESGPQFTIGKKGSIDVEALHNSFVAMIASHPEITPCIGKEHTWSPAARKYMHFGFMRRLGTFLKGEGEFPAPLLGRSKLFLTLACGFTSRFLRTGKEEELESRLMAYPDKSVRMDDMLRESYLLNGGDLYLTLLTGENLFSRDIYTKDRAQLPLQKKLQYIRNDSSPEGDNFGAWYHFLGTALFALKRSKLAAKSVALVEAAGSLFLEGPDRQETLMNLRGADFGHTLKKMVQHKSWMNPPAPQAQLTYMHLDEFPPPPVATRPA